MLNRLKPSVLQTAQPHTAQATNQVPLVSGGSLSDLASTMLAILGVNQPVEMTGKPLLKAA